MRQTKLLRGFTLILVILVMCSTIASCGKGTIGPQGEQGIQGEKGDKGNPGAQGEKGEKGAPGEDGVTPHIGENGNWFIGETDTGVAARGETGLQGEKGESGTQGIKGDTGAQGEKGEKGDTGAQGEKGEKGDTGAQGEKGDPGRGISGLEFNADSELIVTYTDGTTQNLGKIPSYSNSETEKQILVYSLLSDGTYGVMAGSDAAEQATITIPETYNEIPVTQILGSGFINLASLQTVVLPNSIKEIGPNAFKGCTGLKSITLSNQLTSIGQYAFSNCSVLQTITIPSSVTFIGKYAFYNAGLTSATFEGLTTTYGSEWQLENNVIQLTNWFETINIGYNSHTTSGKLYSIILDISNANAAADYLSGNTVVAITGLDNGPQNSDSRTVRLYIENWIRS